MTLTEIDALSPEQVHAELLLITGWDMARTTHPLLDHNSIARAEKQLLTNGVDWSNYLHEAYMTDQVGIGFHSPFHWMRQIDPLVAARALLKVVHGRTQ